MRRNRLIAAILCGVCLCSTAVAQPATEPATKPSGPQRFEDRVTAFEKQDRESPQPTGAILFVGSSSIAGWKLKEAFPQLQTINRGIVSAHVSDLLDFADRIILPYQPRMIVIYAGENDLAAGKSARRVAEDLEQLINQIQAALPEANLVVIGLKPSPSQAKVAPKRAETNQLYRDLAAKRQRIIFIDVEAAMLDAHGQPRTELFRTDGLHLSPAGYELWTRLLGPQLEHSNRK